MWGEQYLLIEMGIASLIMTPSLLSVDTQFPCGLPSHPFLPNPN